MILLLLMMMMITMVIYCHHLNTRYALLLVVVSFRRMMISAICRKSLTNWTKPFKLQSARKKSTCPNINSQRINFCLHLLLNGTELSSILIFSPSRFIVWHNGIIASQLIGVDLWDIRRKACSFEHHVPDPLFINSRTMYLQVPGIHHYYIV